MRLFLLLIAITIFTNCTNSKGEDNENMVFKEWRHYLGDPGRSHFSTLEKFTVENVQSLKIAWEYESPDFGQMQMNPIVVDTLMFGVSAALRAFALDARTGKQVWMFGDSLKEWHSNSRGVSFWENKTDKRIFFTHGPDLWALNAITGKPVLDFGNNGKIDLRSGLREADKEKFVLSGTPGTVFKNTIIMPLRLSESAGAARGDLIAFDTRTGNVVWTFNTIPLPGNPGHDTWGDSNVSESTVVGGANSWAGTTLDLKNEILYVPTGSAAPDFYGGMRPGKNLFANSLLALDANSGKYLWHFQFTHHDLWDRDLPAPPNLVKVVHGGKEIDAVSQVTKQGYVFLFDRITGKPLFEIEERKVPMSELDGEQAWPTQPFPIKPKPYARQIEDLSENDISPYAQNQEELREILVKAKKQTYSPPGLSPMLIFPGYDGGAEWGGTGADPNKGILYINSNEMAWFLSLKKTTIGDETVSPGNRLYLQKCAVCHQANKSGLPESGYPDLQNITVKLSETKIQETIKQGKGMMPGFPELTPKEMQHLIQFLSNSEDKNELTSENLNQDLANFVPYQHTGYEKFLDNKGLPAISPPWGTLQALDLNTGEYLWKIPFGETDSLRVLGYPTTGSENYGGPVITENGLLFIAASKDGYIRAFDRNNGKLLWVYKLPAAAFATPSLYEIEGKQFLVIACGGEKLGTEKGNKIIAFSLE